MFIVIVTASNLIYTYLPTLSLRASPPISVGTGVCVGLVVHGKPTRGFSHCDIAHILVPRLADDATPSVCRFHDDCVEGLASGTALKARLGGRPLAEEIGRAHV